LDIFVKVIPNAKTSEVVGWEQDPLRGKVLRVRIKAPPVDGKANKELSTFLAKHYGFSKSQVKVAKGKTSRFKVVTLPEINL